MRATDTLNNSRNTRALDFLIAGAQKSGTTALAEYLRRHPDICMPKNKESHFLDDKRQFTGQAPDYDAYQRCFAPSHDGQVLGEATPTYMFWDATPERI
jgi:hypothetical protein